MVKWSSLWRNSRHDFWERNAVDSDRIIQDLELITNEEGLGYQYILVNYEQFFFSL